MTSKSPLEEAHFASERVVQQFILQQATAAAAAQTEPARLTRQEAFLQDTDLLSSDVAEGDIPPPAYGEAFGGISDAKNGTGTSAFVTDDGRVNIHINQLNRRLSQIFAPALRQQVQSAQDSRAPPSSYIPPSLGGEEAGSPPPPLNIVIQVVGSRGDVQPFVALGKVLRETYGHRVRLATHPNFKNFVQENGLEFFSIGGDPSRLMAFMVKNPSLMPGFRSILGGDVSQQRRDVAEYIQGCWRSCYEAGDGMNNSAPDDKISERSESPSGSELTARPFVADCIIANPPSFAHIHCAEKLGIPLHIMFTMPYSATQAFPHPLANIQSSNADPRLTNYISYVMIELLSWQGLGDIINRFRAKCLELDPISLIWAPGMLHRLKVPHTYCWSPALIPKPKDWGPNISVSGFYLLNLASNYTPTPDLQAFLDAGPPPVYIGFGSIVLDNPDAMTELIFETVRITGQRILLSKGWGGIGADGLRIPDGVFMLGNVPHDWLFNRVSCVVHHGGAGTTAAGIAAGRPTVIVPFFGDQPFWGAMVARAGAGPEPIPHKQLTADNLANAINFCLKPERLERARELAGKMAAERGSDMGAQSFHQYLDVDGLRCMLAPSRAAAWRIRGTQVRISAFAACALANAKLLEFHDLKLFRAREYYTDEGPWDPVSGGAAACFRAFSGMAMGLAEGPSETLRPLQFPTWSGRQQSKESLPTVAKDRENSHTRDGFAGETSPERNESSFNIQESPPRVQSPPSLSCISTAASATESSPVPDAPHAQLRSISDDYSQRGVRSRSEFTVSKDHDMLRQRGVHTSRGLGRFAKAAFQAPMEISVGLTKGFHNFPRLWGDDTVRPQEKVSDFKSGAVAAGKEFGYGWYDGVTGLVTQPWKGAQKEGVSGFAKGVGKGLGGFVTKPFAALAGILGHTMKGVHKEMQKLFGSNVQNYIVASRVAQGYEEWLLSSDAEKEDIIVRWKLIEKHLKKKGNLDGMVQSVIDSQQKKGMDETTIPRSRGYATNLNQSTGTDATLDPGNTTVAVDNFLSGQESLIESENNGEVSVPVQETSHGNADVGNAELAAQENVFQTQRQQQEAADHQSEHESFRQAIVASEIEAQRHARERLEYEKQLQRVMARSKREQGHSSSSFESGFDLDYGEEEENGSKQVVERFGNIKRKAVPVGSSAGVQQPSSYDPGHLGGTTKREFESQNLEQGGEKTTQERREEEIVIEYIKRESLLKMPHRNGGKGRATAMAIQDEDDKDLQEALKLSMQRI